MPILTDNEASYAHDTLLLPAILHSFVSGLDASSRHGICALCKLRGREADYHSAKLTEVISAYARAGVRAEVITAS